MDAYSLRRRINTLQKNKILTRSSAHLAGDLLEQASNRWTVYLSREQACELCQVTDWGSARRSLNRLKDAGLIGMHTNLCAYIYFLEPPAEDPDRAETARQRAETAREEPDDLTLRAETARPRAETARPRAETARPRAETARPLRIKDQDQLQEGRIDPSYPALDPMGGAGGPEPAPKLRDGAPERIDPAEQTRSVQLLTHSAVGVYPKLAAETAAVYSFRKIAAQVFRYFRDHAAGGAFSPGCIPGRLSKPEQFPAEMELEDFQTDLWLDHAGEDDLEWGRQAIRRKYIPEEYADIIIG